MNSEIFAYIGGFLVITCLIPQIIKSFRTKSTKDLSLYMVVLALLGGISYTFFGFSIGSIAIISTNLIYCIFAVMQLFLKIKYTKK
ncbi:MAG: SemiSWEET family transporter [archaeon]